MSAPEPVHFDDDEFRGKSFQHLAWAYTEHVYSLAAEGIFDGNEEGQQAALPVLLYFAHHTARNTDTDKGRMAGFVLEGKISQKAIKSATRQSEKTIQRAVGWLRKNGFIHLWWVREGKKQYYGAIQITSWNATTEAQRKEWLARQQADDKIASDADFVGNQSPRPVVPVTMTGSTSHSDRVFNTDSYTKDTPTKSDIDLVEPSAGDKSLKPAADHGNDDQPLEDTDAWLETIRASWTPEQPAERDDLVTFYVGRSKRGTPYLAMEGSRSDRFPDGRKFVAGMDEGQVRLTPEQVTGYFKARETHKRRWRDLNRHYYDLAMETDPGFRKRAPKRTVNERGREYNNSFWVQTEGDHAGYFTRTHLADQQPGEVRVELTPLEASRLFALGEWMVLDGQREFVENRTERVEFMRDKLRQLGRLEYDLDAFDKDDDYELEAANG